MFNNLANATLQDASEDDLLAAMGGDAAVEKPKATVKGKNQDSKANSQKSNDSSKSVPATNAAVTDADDDDLEDAFGSEENEDKKPKDKSKKESDSKTEEDEEEEENEDEGKDEDDEDEDKDKEDESGADEELLPSFLKARALMFIQKGEWKAFEKDGKKPDELEWSEELFEEIDMEQRAADRTSLREDLLESFGPYGRDIATYSENGGNPDDLLDIFKEEQAVKVIDITTEDGQKEMVYQYQTQILNRSATRANKEIERLIADKMLAEDAEEAKTVIEKSLKEKHDKLLEDQAQYEEDRKAREISNRTKFITDVKTAVDAHPELTADEKKEMIKALTTFKTKLSNGQVVNDFYAKLAEFRKDLPNYLEMVRLVLNPKKYKETFKKEGQSAAAEKAFKMAKTANATKSAKPNAQIENNHGVKTSSKFKIL